LLPVKIQIAEGIFTTCIWWRTLIAIKLFFYQIWNRRRYAVSASNLAKITRDISIVKPKWGTFLFNLLKIKGLYMFRALLAHPQEVLHKRHLVYCVRVLSVDCYQDWSGTGVSDTDQIPQIFIWTYCGVGRLLFCIFLNQSLAFTFSEICIKCSQICE
jgi:hypothetical protein